MQPNGKIGQGGVGWLFDEEGCGQTTKEGRDGETLRVTKGKTTSEIGLRRGI